MKIYFVEKEESYDDSEIVYVPCANIHDYVDLIEHDHDINAIFFETNQIGFILNDQIKDKNI